MSELRICGLQKSFDGNPVLHGIDLSVERGTLLALLGPSGSGKTTLLRVLCGFERADRGTVEIDGRRVAGDALHVPSEQRRIGYVPQEGALFPHLSVADNIVFGLPRTQRRARHRVAELLELVGLPASFAERAPQQLSGGQQQRVALARALAPSPTLVMLDEPFSSLDAALRLETRQAVASALAAAGATAVLVTHDQSEALSLGHEVAVLWHGKLIQTATPEMIYRRPVTRELASFIGEAVLLQGVAARDRVTCELGELTLVGACERWRRRRDGAPRTDPSVARRRNHAGRDGFVRCHRSGRDLPGTGRRGRLAVAVGGSHGGTRARARLPDAAARRARQARHRRRRHGLRARLNVGAALVARRRRGR